MPSEQELSAAVDRLRQCRGGNKQTLCDVYQTPNVFDAQERHAEDESLVAQAYLALGTRQPGYVRRDVSGMRKAIFTTFIQEVLP